MFVGSTHRDNAVLKAKVISQEVELKKMDFHLQKKIQELDDLAADIRDLLGEKSRWDSEMRKLEELMKENSSLHEDNAMLLRELD